MSIDIYQQHQRLLETTPSSVELAPYDWGRLPSPLYITWMAYGQMFNEFSSELSNVLNAFRGYVRQLTAWRDVLAPMSLDQQIDAAVDFVDPLATLALNLPYVIHSRFVFASAHLCHQANRAKQLKDWTDNFPLDQAIKRGMEDRYGAGWGSFGAFKDCLKKIDAHDYRTATRDFRNAYTHRFSPRIVLGVSNLVTRRVDKTTGAVSYAFGETPALTLPHVVAVLDTQCQHAFDTFQAFQRLVREHEAAISDHNAECLKAIDRGHVADAEY